VQAAQHIPLCTIIHTHGVAWEQAEGADWGGQQAPPTYLLLHEPVPHELLLPQCALVVHHGGAGTTQAALLAGEEQVVSWSLPAPPRPALWMAALGHRQLHAGKVA